MYPDVLLTMSPVAHVSALDLGSAIPCLDPELTPDAPAERVLDLRVTGHRNPSPICWVDEDIVAGPVSQELAAGTREFPYELTPVQP